MRQYEVCIILTLAGAAGSGSRRRPTKAPLQSAQFTLLQQLQFNLPSGGAKGTRRDGGG